MASTPQSRISFIRQANSDVYQRNMEKPFKEKILSIVDFLRRGETAPAAMAALKGEDPIEAYKSGVVGKRPQYRMGYSEVLKELGKRNERDDILDNKHVQTWAGLVMDIVLDPTTYVGSGFTKLGRLAQVSKGMKAVNLTGKTGRALWKAQRINAALKIADNVGDVTKLGKTAAEQAKLGQKAVLTFAGQPILPKVASEAIYKGAGKVSTVIKATRAGKGITRAFKGALDPAFRELLATRRSTIEHLSAKWLLRTQDNITKALKGVPQKDLDNIITLIEKSRTAPELMSDIGRKYGAGVQLAAENAKKYPGVMLRMEQMRKLGVAELGGEFSYLLRTQHPKTIKQLEKLGYKKRGVGGNLYSSKMSEQIMRKTKDIGVLEINKYAKAGKLPEIGINIPHKLPHGLFVTDLGYITAVRGLHSAKAIANQEFLEKAAKLFGKTVDEAPPVYRGVGLVTAKGTRNPLKGLKFDPEIARELEKQWAKMTDSETMNGMLKGFDTVQNWWKSWTLGIFPSFHIRNEIGNIWNNSLAGVKNPTVYMEARRIQDTARMGKITTKNKVLLNEASKRGVVRGGAYTYEAAIEPALRGSTAARIITPSRKNLILEKGFKFGQYLEDNARLAHFIDKVKKGHSFDDAAKSVKKYLFDYGELSDFERVWMRRLFPFFTWSRKNIPLQAEVLFTSPGRFATIEKTRKALSGGEEPERAYLPDWLKERYAFRIGELKEGVGKYFPLESWLPAADLFKLLRPTDIPADLLSPLIKTPLEIKMNKSMYFKKEIQRYKGEKQQFLFFDIPAKANYLIRNIRLLNEMDRIFGARARNLSKKEIIVRSVAGVRLYPLEIQRAKAWYMKERKKTLNELRYARTQAIRRGREKNAIRITRKIEKVMRELAEVR